MKGKTRAETGRIVVTTDRPETAGVLKVRQTKKNEEKVTTSARVHYITKIGSKFTLTDSGVASDNLVFFKVLVGVCRWYTSIE